MSILSPRQRRRRRRRGRRRRAHKTHHHIYIHTKSSVFLLSLSLLYISVLVFIFSSEGRANAEIWTSENLKNTRRKDKVVRQFSSRPRKRIFGGQLILLFLLLHKRRGFERALLLLIEKRVLSLLSKKKEKKTLQSFCNERGDLKSSSTCRFSNSLSSGRDRRVPSARPLLLFLLGILRTTEDGMEKELLVFLRVLKRSRRRN